MSTQSETPAGASGESTVGAIAQTAGRSAAAPCKAVVNLSTGLEDPERVTVAFLTAVGAVESGHPTVMFLSKEAVRLAVRGIAVGTACVGCPPLADLLERYHRGGGRFLVCPICVDAKGLGDASLVDQAERGGVVPLWEWMGPEAASVFSF